MNTKLKHSEWIDPDDVPVWTEKEFSDPKGEWRIGDQLVTREEARAELAKRGRGRPKSEAAKVAVKLRLDPDLLAVLRATGDGWQTRVNRILRERFAL
ncbi:BrnA antitoxin family protein [Thermomonas sp.]|uniref:BrnA antitoxin family protein n=1 Tax=Thermomonas sp. TaxID=1971895 RepID=UPI0035B4A929